MGEIVDFIKLYIEEEGVLEEKLDDIALAFVEKTQNQLYRGHGRRSGDLKDGISSDYTLSSPTEGVVRGFIKGPAGEYGWYVNDGHTLRNGKWWEGYHFMEDGLEETVALYR